MASLKVKWKFGVRTYDIYLIVFLFLADLGCFNLL